MVTAVQAQWVRTAKTRAFSFSNGVAPDADGNVFTVGVFTCVTSFDGTTLSNNACGEITPPAPTETQTDGFIAKRDDQGNLLWVVQFAGSPGNRLFVSDVAVDLNGDAYVVGAFTGSLDLVAETLSNPDGTTEYFIAKVRGTDGAVEWVQSDVADAESETAARKIVTTKDAIYVTGSVRDDFQIGAVTDSTGREASFVASFDFDGSHRWTDFFREINPNGQSRGKAITAHGDSIWVFSSFRDTVAIAGTPTPPPGPDGTIEAGVICLYDAAGTLLNTIITNTPKIEALAFHRPHDRLYLTGRSEGITAVGEDTLFTAAGTRAFVSSHDVDANATLQWFVPITAGATVPLTGTGISISPSGDVLAGGVFRGASVSLPSSSAAGGGDVSAFLLRLDAAGNESWVQTLGGSGYDTLSSVAASADDRIYVSGYYSNYLRVAGDELHSTVPNSFTARVDICPALRADRISADTTYICDRDVAILSALNNPSYSYQWYHEESPITGATMADVEATEAGYYRAEVTGEGCTKFTPPALLILNPLPDSQVITNDPLERCEGDTVRLTGPVGSYTFMWYRDGAPTALTSRDVKITTDGDYHLRIEDAIGCSIESDTFALRFHAYPSDVLTPPPGVYTFCSGDGMQLHADDSQPGMVWQWKRDNVTIADATTASLTITESGIYHAVVTNSIGCATTTLADTVIVQLSPVVNLNDNVLPSSICEGESIRFVSPFVIGQTYQWFRNGSPLPSATENTLDVNEAGTYQVRANNTLCEAFSETFDLTVNELPDAEILNPTPASICEGDGYALLAREEPDYQYQWLRNGQLITDGTEPSLSVGETGNYSLRVANVHGCTDTSPATFVQVNLLPPALLTTNDPLTFCEGGSAILLANAGNALTYQWLRNGVVVGGQAQRSLEASMEGSYQVRVTNSNLCSNVSAPLVVETVAYPVATLSADGGQTSVCEGSALLLRAGSGPGYNYRWMHNGLTIVGASGPEYEALAAGSYRVIAEVAACRDTSAAVTLNLKPNPKPVIERNEAFLSIALFGNIQWYHNGSPIAGANLQSVRVNQDGVYHVEVVNQDGCEATSEPLPMCVPLVQIRRDQDVLEVTPAASSYAWYYYGLPVEGGVGRRLTAQQSGEYSVVVTSDDGCVMETEPVTVCVPYPYIEEDDFSGVLYAFPHPATSYQWYLDGMAVPGGTTQVHIPEAAGSYYVEVTDLDGCVSTSRAWTISPITGVDSPWEVSLRFFPNPVRDVLIVESELAEEARLLMVDAMGREVLNLAYPLQNSEIDLRSFPAGTYIIRIVTSGGQQAAWKLVKE